MLLNSDETLVLRVKSVCNRSINGAHINVSDFIVFICYRFNFLKSPTYYNT